MNPTPETPRLETDTPQEFSNEHPVAAADAAAAAASPEIVYVAAPKRTLWQRVTSSRFLLVSVGAHLLLGLGATLFVVQSITAKRKLTFTAAPPSPNPGTRAMEHKVQMAQKQKAMSAPQTKRVTTTAVNAKVALPSMPSMPSMPSTLANNKMAGMNSAGLGLSTGPVGTSSGGGGGPVPFFGFRNQTGGALIGSFYDLKQTGGRQPNGMNEEKYKQTVEDFIKGGWAESRFGGFYRAIGKLSATQIFVPDIPASEGPKAFGVEKEVQPNLWVAHYKGKVSPPESGTYHFVGHGDDVLYVRFNGRTVLDACWYSAGKSPLAKAEGSYDYNWPSSAAPSFRQFIKGEGVQVEAGKFYSIEILLGEQPGGFSHFCLMIEKDGQTYEKNAEGKPLLPIFRLAQAATPKGNLPPFSPNGPIWRAEGTGSAPSLLDTLRR